MSGEWATQREPEDSNSEEKLTSLQSWESLGDKYARGPEEEILALAPHRHSIAMIGVRDRLYKAKSQMANERASANLVQELAESLHAAVRSIDDFANDSNLWRALHRSAGDLHRVRIENLIDLADHRLEPLLLTFGIKEPPPPSARELVDQTVDALATTAEAALTSDVSKAELTNARKYLHKFLERIRLQLDPSFAPKQRGAVLRAASARVVSLLHHLIPAAVAAAAGAAAGPMVGIIAVGASTMVIEAIKALTGEGLKLAAASLIGHAQTWILSEKPPTYPSVPVFSAELAAAWVRVETLDSTLRQWIQIRAEAVSLQWDINEANEAWHKAVSSIIEEISQNLQAYTRKHKTDFADGQISCVDRADSELHSFQWSLGGYFGSDSLSPETTLHRVEELRNTLRSIGQNTKSFNPADVFEDETDSKDQ